MKIGISTATFFSKLLTEDSFAEIKELGFDCIEVFLTTFREYEEEFIKLLKEKQNGIQVFSVHTLNQQFEPELFNSVARTREDAFYFLRKIARAAQILDAKYYTFHGPARLKRTPYTFDFAKLGATVETINSVLSEYSPSLELAYENVHWTFFSEPDFFTNLKKYTTVKTCLDIKQAMQSKIPVKEYIDAMGETIVNIHLCDYFENGKLTLPGKGIFNFTELFKRLKDVGYDGPAMLELYAGDYTNFKEIKDSYDYLNDCLNKS